MTESPRHSTRDDHDDDRTPGTPGILTVKLGFAYRMDPPIDQTPGKSERWRPYVIGEYEGFQLSSEALRMVAAEGSISWETWDRPFKFEVPPSPSKELTLSFFARDRDADAATSSSSLPSGGPEPWIVSLGFIKLNPFSFSPGTKWVDVQNSLGRVHVEITYTQKEIAPLEEWRVWTIQSTGEHGLVYVKEKDTGLNYGMEVVDIRSVEELNDTDINVAPVMASGLCLRSAIQHPFIAPLKFTYVSSDGPLKDDPRLNVLAPLASGGYLFDHVQRERRLSPSHARFYAAELVSIVEYLHGKDIILGCLNLENILLDASGHVSLCKPSLFWLGPGGDRILPGTSQYPAPEVLDGRKKSRAGDWWSLGVILYELLTGSPPFYHKDSSERQCRIRHQDLQLPMILPSSARDILTRLLIKDPTHRLGVNGTAEVKDHLFLRDVKWDCMQQYATPFKPHDAAMVFWRDPYTCKTPERPQRERREFKGEMYEQLGNDEWPLWRPLSPVLDQSVPVPLSTRDNREWGLVWERADGELYFEDQTTGKRIVARAEPPGSPIHGERSPAAEHPSEKQKKDALAAALKAGYSEHVFSQILDYGVNLDTHTFDRDLVHVREDESRLSPLELAVVYERLDLVRLFLDHGADASYTASPRDGPAVVLAVRQNHQRLVEMLVQQSDRVSCTRALALAVEQQDTPIVTSLLAHGVHCDFEESDRPLPPVPPFTCDFAVQLWEDLKAEDLTPPLVRAARLGYTHQARLLLSHGADVNVGYHVLGGRGTKSERLYRTRDDRIRACFSCGRAVQLAMEMGHIELVRLLVDAGADIDLAHPTWCVRGHVCQPVPRTVYLEVMDGLTAVVASRRDNQAEVSISS